MKTFKNFKELIIEYNSTLPEKLKQLGLTEESFRNLPRKLQEDIKTAHYEETASKTK